MRQRPVLAGAALLTLVLVAGCGEEGSSSGDTGSGSGSGSEAVETTGGEETAAAGGDADCAPVPGEALVVLEDDQNLQTVDNIIPAVHADAASEPLLGALDAVSAALTTEELTELNRQVVVERRTSPEVAAEWVESEGLTEQVEGGGSGSITVGAANFAENQTLAEIYAVVLDAAGFDATTQTIGNREIYLQALQSGEIQVVPEYVGTVTEFLNAQQNGAGAEPVASGDLQATVEGLQPLAEGTGLVFGEPSEAADQNAFAVTDAFAEEHGVESLSDLAETCAPETLVLGGPPECPERPFCQPGLEETYGFSFEGFEPLDAGGPLTQTALRQGRISLGLVFSSDGSLSGPAEG